MVTNFAPSRESTWAIINRHVSAIVDKKLFLHRVLRCFNPSLTPPKSPEFTFTFTRNKLIINERYFYTTLFLIYCANISQKS